MLSYCVVVNACIHSLESFQKTFWTQNVSNIYKTKHAQSVYPIHSLEFLCVPHQNTNCIIRMPSYMIQIMHTDRMQDYKCIQYTVCMQLQSDVYLQRSNCISTGTGTQVCSTFIHTLIVCYAFFLHVM